MQDTKGKVSDKVTLTVRETSGKTFLDVTADDQWLQEAEYPVLIDPTIASGSPTWDVHKDTLVSSGYPTYDFSSYTYLLTGYEYYYGYNRSYVQFVLPSLMSSAKINSATFSMYQTASGLSTYVDLYRVTSFWDAAATNWNNQPTIGSMEASLYNITAHTTSIGTGI